MKINRKNNKRAYTLIEVVIVVGCIALISAIFGPKLVGMFSSTSVTQHVANAKAANDLLNEFTGAGGTTAAAYAAGTVTTPGTVRIDTVAVAQGNLVVKVEETQQVSQPGALAPAGAETVVTTNTTVSAEESKNKLGILQHGASLRELIAGLNALGVGPRDLITILQTIKAAGALQAEIVAK